MAVQNNLIIASHKHSSAFYGLLLHSPSNNIMNTCIEFYWLMPVAQIEISWKSKRCRETSPNNNCSNNNVKYSSITKKLMRFDSQ